MCGKWHRLCHCNDRYHTQKNHYFCLKDHGNFAISGMYSVCFGFYNLETVWFRHHGSPNESSNIIKDHRISSTSFLNGPTTANGMSSKNEVSPHKASTFIQDDEILMKPTPKMNSKTSQIDITNHSDNKSEFYDHTSSEEKSSTSSIKSQTTMSPQAQDSVIPNEGTSIGGIVIVSILSIILSSSIFASNLLVMIPFNRCTRIRTPSNFLLLVLSISDLVIGIVVIPLVTITTILRYVILLARG